MTDIDKALNNYMNAREISDVAFKVWEEDVTNENHVIWRDASKETMHLKRIYLKLKILTKLNPQSCLFCEDGGDLATDCQPNVPLFWVYCNKCLMSGPIGTVEGPEEAIRLYYTRFNHEDKT